MPNKLFIFSIALLIQISLFAKADTIFQHVNSVNEGVPAITWNKTISKNFALKINHPFGVIIIKPSPDNEFSVQATPGSWEPDQGNNPLKNLDLTIDESGDNLTISVVIPEYSAKTQKRKRRLQDHDLIYPDEVLAFNLNLEVLVPTYYLNSLNLNGQSTVININGLKKTNPQIEMLIEILTESSVDVYESSFAKLIVKGSNYVDLRSNEGLLDILSSENKEGRANISDHLGDGKVKASHVGISNSSGYFDITFTECVGGLSISNNPSTFKFNIHQNVLTPLDAKSAKECRVN